jgi:hypothetical protein
VPHYVVTTKRALRGIVSNARDAVRNAPGVKVVDERDPEMVQIEATEEAAESLKKSLANTHFVDPVTRHKLH